MNASAQALSISIVSKIANISVIVQEQFPSVNVDFSPWLLNEQEQKQFDPDSIDIAFSFPTWQPPLSCGCLLLQVYLDGDIQSPKRRVRKIKLTGHNLQGQHWRFSTHSNCQFSGSCVPSPEGQQQLKSVITKLHTLFGNAVPFPLQQDA
ncbi:MAG: hypothetical protein AAFV85_09045 [Cyanobacteria bacterium J06634_6]